MSKLGVFLSCQVLRNLIISAKSLNLSNDHNSESPSISKKKKKNCYWEESFIEEAKKLGDT